MQTIEPSRFGRPSLRYAEISMGNTSKCDGNIEGFFKLVF